MYHLQLESQAILQAQRIFQRLGGKITQVSSLVITNDILLYTQCYVHSYNKLLRKGL